MELETIIKKRGRPSTKEKVIKPKKETSVYSELIKNFSEIDYDQRKTMAYQHTSIKYFDKIRYLTRSYTCPENLLNLPITNEQELLEKYNKLKLFCDELKLERLKTGNVSLQRIKYTKKLTNGADLG